MFDTTYFKVEVDGMFKQQTQLKEMGLSLVLRANLIVLPREDPLHQNPVLLVFPEFFALGSLKGTTFVVFWQCLHESLYLFATSQLP